MTIRFTCDKCGSVLKIKDELAGTDGKCPKCKTRFVVPPPSTDEPATEKPAAAKPAPAPPPEAPEAPAPVVAAVAMAPAEPAPEPVAKAAAKPAAKPPAKASPKPAAEDDEFDPVSFLMESPKKKPTFEADPVPDANFKSPMAGGRSPKGGGFSLDDDSPDGDSDFDAPPPPTRKWGAKKDAAAERSMGGSTNAAKELLARSMEESRIRAAQMPEEKPRFTFDFAGFFREFGLKAGGLLAGTVFGVLGVYMLISSMMNSGPKLPPLGYVTGTVTLHGKPAPGVKVILSPIDSTIPGAQKKEKARDSTGITDQAGKFTMYYSDETEGVKIGPCRLSMEAFDPAVVIPSSYGLASDHKLDVKSGNNEPQKIEL